ncbi:intracellular protein transport protein [Aspergillus indologenus CBS 114.80]|uniref:Intracellular protein transport protein n=1 Tax=Aspergillus indologenus CBS 114.80 TaxID=1450541 RepID=A0A2V5IZK5_9EURO|nr:intracellular protein transport protein [Aspergillus indologenus CBS 114.80]
MFRILESQAPAKQTATDTINTLSSRLQSATLLEDRRAAIQGLRSFSKTYPASVASGALRPLISCLRNDREDVDTIKVVLETLLMLFTPDENSPEASDEIALWLSDEFTQRQDNITALLDLLDTRDFYSRLYSLQLMFQISSARPERTQECILTAPLGIPRLVSALGDSREPVRNEALLLLIALTPASEEFQKLVAFENAFDLIFSLIEAEGALNHGSEVVEDCLSLLANLLRLNISNQSYFRETGCVKRLAKLLADANQDQESEDQTLQWTFAHRDKNIWGLLVIIQLFLVKGGVNTPANQMAFWNHGVMEQVLSTAFGQRFNVNVTAKALATCADLIRANKPLQERFGDVEVVWGPQEANNAAANGTTEVKQTQPINVIEALLKLTLEPAPISLLDARLAACECVKAFFANHSGIRVHVLGRAIQGHVSGEDQIPNILSVLLTPPESRGNADPYQTWMAAVLMYQLLWENPEAKEIAMGVTEGDAEQGEEVVTCIQTIVGNLITGLQRGDDERITLGYLMLLCGWLYEEPDAVNDFLGEGSSIQSLLQEVKHRGVSNVPVPGLCTILLGIIYEFSSKDSPIPRKTLHKLILDQLGREQYIDRITRFREAPLVRDFEVLPQTVGAQSDGGLPEIYFDRAFIEFLKDNFSRLTRAIDREPELEISIITNGVERGVSRELVDTLRAEIEEKGNLVQKLEEDLLALQSKFEQEQAEHRKTRDSTAVESTKLQQVTESLKRSHEKDIAALKEQQKRDQNELSKKHEEQIRACEKRLKETAADYERQLYHAKKHHDGEAADLRKHIRSLETDLARVRDQHVGEIAKLKATIQKLSSEAEKIKGQHVAEVLDLNSTIQSLQSGLESNKEQHTAEMSELQKTAGKLQSELELNKQKHASELSHLNKTIEDLRSQLEVSEEKHAEFSAQSETISTLQSEIDAQKGKHAEELSSLNKTIKDLQSALQASEEKHAAELSAQSSTSTTLQSELDSQKAKHGEEMSDLNKTIDDLRSKHDAAKEKHAESLSELQKTIDDLQSTLDTDREKHAKSLSELQKTIEDLQSGSGANTEKHAHEVSGLNDTIQTLKLDIDKIKQQHKAEIAEHETTKQGLQSELKSTIEKSTHDLQSARDDSSDKHAALEKRIEKAESEVEQAKAEAQKTAAALEAVRKELEKARSEASEKEEARQAAQSELEDLLIVFGDLEAKRNQDKQRLKDLGQEVSEAEDEDEDEDDEEEEDEEDE